MPTATSQYSWRIISKYFAVFMITAGFFVTALLAQVTFLALISRFTYPFVIGSIFVSAVLSTVFFLKIKKDSVFLPRITLPSVLLTFLVVLLLIYFPHDTFGGRDEAGYANYAVYLTKHGTLKFPSYLDTVSNKYVEHIQSTLPAYTSWLALNKILFGAQWMLRSNSVLIGLGLMAFFMVASFLGGSRIGLLASALYATSMPFLWFSRETMTENLSFFLLWYLLLMFFTFTKTKRLVYIPALILGGWLFALTRIEGFVIQLILFAILFFVMFKNRFLPRHVVFVSCLYLLALISAVLVTMKLSFALYVFPTVNNVRNDMTHLVQPSSIANLPVSSLYRNISKFTLNMLQKYNYNLAIFSIVIVTVFMLIRAFRHGDTMKKYAIVFLIISPEFIKLLNPGVTLDQPWFYRRFIYAILPFGYISLALLLTGLPLKNKKQLSIIILSMLCVINLYYAKDILFLKNNWNLYNSLSSVTEGVTTKDFVIIRNTAFGYYYPASYLLLQKDIRSAYFSTLDQKRFDPENKLFNDVAYNHLFLLSSREENAYPQFRIVLLRSVAVDYSQLEPSCQLYLLGSYLSMYDTYNYSRLPYKDAVNYCKNPGNTINTHKEKLYFYELFYQG